MSTLLTALASLLAGFAAGRLWPFLRAWARQRWPRSSRLPPHPLLGRHALARWSGRTDDNLMGGKQPACKPGADVVPIRTNQGGL